MLWIESNRILNKTFDKQWWSLVSKLWQNPKKNTLDAYWIGLNRKVRKWVRLTQILGVGLWNNIEQTNSIFPNIPHWKKKLVTSHWSHRRWENGKAGCIFPLAHLTYFPNRRKGSFLQHGTQGTPACLNTCCCFMEVSLHCH